MRFRRIGYWLTAFVAAVAAIYSLGVGRQSKKDLNQERIAAVVATYAAAWNESDEAKRAEMLQHAWADDGVYSDPTVHLEGRDALSKHIQGFLSGQPGMKIVLTSGVDHHHGQLRFTWQLEAGAGNVVVQGIDFGELAEDGRLRRITGFFGPVPAPE